MDKYQVELTFVEPILGTVPKNPEIYKKYIAGIAALDDEQIAEELVTVQSVEEKGWTGFHQLEGRPLLYDYHIKGFLKDACGMLRRVSSSKSAKLRAYKKIIDGLVFVTPRRIMLDLNGLEMGTLERSLRASTAQGDRVTLARSDVCPEGTTMAFEITVLGQVPRTLLCEWLDYGQLRGLGQWRNAGYGRFEYSIEVV